MNRPAPECPIKGSTGFAPFVGPESSRIAFLAEAAGRTEAYKSEPLVGEAGFVFDRLLEQVGLQRSQLRIGNVRGCHPVNDWLVGAPWENSPCNTCDLAVERLLESRPRDSVIVTLGGYALRKLMGYQRVRGKEEGGIRVQDFHGAPVRHPRYPVWIVPTFHPSYLNRTALRLFKTAIFDISVAQELAAGTWSYDLPELVIDPPPEWVEAWVQNYLAALAQDPEGVWLAVDLEWRDKDVDEGEVEAGEESDIQYINLSCSPDEGTTFPAEEPYWSLFLRAIDAGGRLIFHNAPTDVRHINRARKIRQTPGTVRYDRIWDSMDAFHVLHPAHPRGLGYVAPFASQCPPWKHLGNTNGTYRAMDGVQTLRVMRWLYQRLHNEGMWHVFEAITRLDYLALRPAEAVGLPIDKSALEHFDAQMEDECRGVVDALQSLVPDEVKPLAGPLVRRPPDGDVVEVQEPALIKVCESCGKEAVHAKHRCENKQLTPAVTVQERVVARYYRREAFNPASWQQVLAYIKHKGHKPGKAKKTGADSTDKKTLQRLSKTGDPVYPLLERHRRAGKMGGTYGAGLIPRIDSEGRIHGLFTHAPWTMRLASSGPNLQNLADHVQYAAEFNQCIEAAPGCRFAKLDFSGIEAVEVGYYSGDPQYLRLAKLSIHTYVLSHLIGKPADPKWSDADLKLCFAELKAAFPLEYEKAKRCVHGRNYGLTEFGMAEYYPEVFPKRSDAARVIRLYEEVCPALPKWWDALRTQADRKKFLGGPGDMQHYVRFPGTPGPHPFGYRAEFYEIYQYRRSGGSYKKYLGEDAKRAAAFFPQSTGGGILYASTERLFDRESRLYVGDTFNGRTPLRALVHDDMRLEIPDTCFDDVLAKCVASMTQPIQQQPMPAQWKMGDYLSIGVGVKVGRNWAPYHPAQPCDKPECAKKHLPNPEGMRSIGVEDLAADVERVSEDEEAA